MVQGFPISRAEVWQICEGSTESADLDQTCIFADSLHAISNNSYSSGPTEDVRIQESDQRVQLPKRPVHQIIYTCLENRSKLPGADDIALQHLFTSSSVESVDRLRKQSDFGSVHFDRKRLMITGSEVSRKHCHETTLSRLTDLEFNDSPAWDRLAHSAQFRRPLRPNFSSSLSSVGSLPPSLERRFEFIGSNPLPHGLVAQLRIRKDSLNSDQDISVSNESSAESHTTGNSDSPPPHTPKHYLIPDKASSLSAQHGLPLSSSSVDYATNHSTLTTEPDVNHIAVHRGHAGVSKCATSKAKPMVSRRRSHRIGYRARGASKLFPTNLAINPFLASPQTNCAAVVTAGRRRWMYARPLVGGVPIVPHRNPLSSRCWDFIPPGLSETSLSEIWYSYFNFLRDQYTLSQPEEIDAAKNEIDSQKHSHSTASDDISFDIRSTVPRASKSVQSQQGSKKSNFSSDCINEGPTTDKPSIPKSSALRSLFKTARRVTARLDSFSFSSTTRTFLDRKTASLMDTLTLVSVDWKSLSVPASLPIETDFFPDTSTLNSEDYALHDYRVVAVGVPLSEWQATNDFEKQPGLHYCRRQLTVREVLCQMLFQRISQGFQLCLDPVSSTLSDQTISSSVRLGAANADEVGVDDRGPAATVRHTTPRSSLKTVIGDRASLRGPYHKTSYFARKQSLELNSRKINTKQSGLQVPGSTSVPGLQKPANFQSLPRTIGVGLGASGAPRSGMPPARSVTITHVNRPGLCFPSNPDSLYDLLRHDKRATVKLSIARLFHSISLDDDSITLTSYRSRREDDEASSWDYTYSVLVPDSMNYVMLRTVFASELTISLNWSYLDNYLSTQGVSESYGLIPSLKFWRSRFMLIPIYTTETKRLSDCLKESPNAKCPPVPFDVYEYDCLSMDAVRICDAFVRFIETVNRVRRAPGTGRKSFIQLDPSGLTKFKLPSDLTFNPMYISIQRVLTALTTSGVVPLGSTLKSSTHHPQSFSSDEFVDFGLSFTETTDDSQTSTLTSFACLNSVHTPVCLVAFLMADSDIGLSFIAITSSPVLPERTFLASDAVAWVLRWFSDIDTTESAVNFLQTILDSGWICHSSGNRAHAFIHGCYFYTLLVPDLKTVYPSGTDAQGGNVFGRLSECVAQSSPTTPNPATVTTGSSSSSAQFPGTAQVATSPNLSTSLLPDASIPTSVGITNALLSSIRPINFPEAFLPKASTDSSGWTADFQVEWAEVALPHRVAYFPLDPEAVATSHVSRNSSHVSDTQSNTSVNGYLTYSNVRSVYGMSENPGYHCSEYGFRKSCICDFDSLEGRSEWAHCLYDANYHPRCAFNMEFQWLVASGARLAELVNNWYHKAGTCNLHFFPAPCYPFGYPSVRSDTNPLRVPLFIPINYSALLDHVSTANTSRTQLTPDLSWTPTSASIQPTTKHSVTDIAAELFPAHLDKDPEHMLKLFQGYVLQRFGFVRDKYSPSTDGIDENQRFSKSDVNIGWTYVHCTGGMFAMIPVYQQDLNQQATVATTSVTATKLGIQHSLINDRNSVASQCLVLETSPQTSLCFHECERCGYFWSWNYMLPKRWRGYVTVDESFPGAILTDFRKFLNAEDNRLTEAFERFKEHELVKLYCAK